MASISARDAPNGQGTKVLIVIWLLMGLASVFIALRVFCKFQTHRGLWWDDHILIISWLLQVATNALVTASVRLGFGKHFWDIDEADLLAIGLVSNVTASVSILAAVLSKTSFAVTLLRITEGYTKIAIWVIIAVMNSSMWLSALFQWIQCNPPRKTRDHSVPGTCWDPSVMTGYNVYSGAISALGDAVLSLLPWSVLFSLRIKRKEKVGVGVAMSMGIFASATAIVKCTKIPELQQGDPTYLATDVTIWSCAEVATTIVAACIPVLRVLLQYIKSSAKKHSSERYGPGGAVPYAGGTRGATTIVTATRNGPKSRAGQDDDSGSDRGILDIRNANQIVQTSEYVVEFHDQGRARTNEDSDSMGGYELTNRTRVAESA